MNLEDRVRAIHETAMLLYNVAPLVIVHRTLTDGREGAGQTHTEDLHPQYMAEQLGKLQAGFAQWWGYLDEHRQRAFARLVERYAVGEWNRDEDDLEIIGRYVKAEEELRAAAEGATRG